MQIGYLDDIILLFPASLEQDDLSDEPDQKLLDAAKGWRWRKRRSRAQGGLGQFGLEDRQFLGPSCRTFAIDRPFFVEHEQAGVRKNSSWASKVSIVVFICSKLKYYYK